MTAFQPYQAYPAPAAVPAAPPPILVAAAPPMPQQRATIAFRAILVIPHLFLLYFMNLAAGVVLFIGWWGALFTGRLPQFAHQFLSGQLRWTSRVWAYYFLLTDIYPPFGFDDDSTYPVRVAVPEPQRLNRAAVFFRFILVFPALFLSGILFYGAGTIMAFVAWIMALANGQLPPGFYLAYTAVLRYMARFYGYYWLLTAAYPSGLFGDPPGTSAWADTLPAGPVPGFGAPGYGPPAPGFGPTAPGYSAPAPAPGFGPPAPPYGTPAPAPGFTPPAWAFNNPAPAVDGPAFGAPAGNPPQAPPAQPGYEATQTYLPGQAAPEPQAPPVPPAYGSSQPPAAPQPFGALPGYTPGAAYGAPPANGAPAYPAAPAYGGQAYGTPAYGSVAGYGARPVFQPATWLLQLTAGARKLVISFIVLGVLFIPAYVGLEAAFFAIGYHARGAETATFADFELDSAHTSLATTLSDASADASRCEGSPSCLSTVYARDAEAYENFGTDLNVLDMPADAAADAESLSEAADTLQQDYDSLARQPVSAAAGPADADTSTFNSAYTALKTLLEGEE